MDAKQHLYYALGQLAYAVAKADGVVQSEERELLHSIVMEQMDNHQEDFDYSMIIFEVLSKDKPSYETTYKWAMDSMALGSHYLTTELKEKFMNVIIAVAKAMPPITLEEQDIINRFKADLDKL